MPMKIVFRNIIDCHGKKMVKIVSIDGVKNYNCLPERYVDGKVRVNMDSGNLVIENKCECNPYGYNFNTFKVGALVNIEMKNWIIKTMKLAGNRLHEINKETEMNKWVGKEEVVII